MSDARTSKRMIYGWIAVLMAKASRPFSIFGFALLTAGGRIQRLALRAAEKAYD